MSYNLNQELRHVKTSHLAHLSTIIDEAKAWTDLLVKLSNASVGSLSITLEMTHLIKRQSSCDKSPTLALLNHWAITGRRRPTLMSLIALLRACNLRRAEAYVWRGILNQEPPELKHQNSIDREKQRPQFEVPAIPLGYQIDDEFKFNDLNSVISKITEECPRYSFDAIYNSTNQFCHRPFELATKIGARIGDGRFSSVFLAHINHPKRTGDQQVPQPLAAKLLKAECNLKYLVNEINLARKIKHDNILDLLGISIDRQEDEPPSYICLIYPYMENGSLLDCLRTGLRCSEGRQILWRDRFEIAFKIARGINYLHSFHEGVIIHRDIKTANILISKDLNPKLGDFTLVRQLDSLKNGGKTQYSQNIIGTSVYMPPEAFRGDISTKFDIFSFGIVMLELVTGLKPFNDEMDEDLLTYISDKLSDIDEQPADEEPRDKFLLKLIDQRAGEWDFDVAKVMFDLALKATEVRKKDRPEVAEIIKSLEGLHNK